MTQGYQCIRAACPGIPRDVMKLRGEHVYLRADEVVKVSLASKFTGTSCAEHLLLHKLRMTEGRGTSEFFTPLSCDSSPHV